VSACVFAATFAARIVWAVRSEAKHRETLETTTTIKRAERDAWENETSRDDNYLAAMTKEKALPQSLLYLKMLPFMRIDEHCELKALE